MHTQTHTQTYTRTESKVGTAYIRHGWTLTIVFFATLQPSLYLSLILSPPWIIFTIDSIIARSQPCTIDHAPGWPFSIHVRAVEVERVEDGELHLASLDRRILNGVGLGVRVGVGVGSGLG